MDKLLAELKTRWPTAAQITLAGFSAGGQFVQHYIGFSHPPVGTTLRFVIGDPGSWLYFDSQPGACNEAQQWKYGLEKLPVWLTERAVNARERYRYAAITTLEGGADDGPGKGKYYGILDKSCAAMVQGEGRKERGQTYHEYEKTRLHPVAPHRFSIVAGCRHDVQCVFNSPVGRRALFG
ncbi:MAG: hypothetical protein XXXJIFNMEKO3_01260 [Candidatus Erwinia impunctatus]|nr:hypothetical protein XXXJIFNMEKO_01260 [Culicoides impunctatus]